MSNNPTNYLVDFLSEFLPEIYLETDSEGICLSYSVFVEEVQHDGAEYEKMQMYAVLEK